ncbi:MAG: hypothetical protein RLZZ450_5169 [Pseudomonadota bacterium]|jgi:hypothetical protein
MNERMVRWLAAGLLLGSVGCGDTDVGDRDGPGVQDSDPRVPPTSGQNPSSASPGTSGPVKAGKPSVTPAKPKPGNPVVPVSTVLASLSAAADCTDLLTQIQDDAIAKLKIQVELYKKHPPTAGSYPGGVVMGGIRDAGAAVSRPTAEAANDAVSPPSGAPATPGASGDLGAATGGGKASGPTGASDTNKQVADVDEADFVKVVENGKHIYLLHGNTLQKLDAWPAAQTKLAGKPLTIEGSPTEMFVTDAGKAVIFSAVYGYGTSNPGYPGKGPIAIDGACAPGFGGCGGYGGNSLKITVVDVTADPKVERELYYEGSYLSSRRYGSGASDVVRTILQALSKYSGLYAPDIEWNDAWGRPYDQADIDSQLAEWEKRTTSSIRKTKLDEWIPSAKQVVSGKLVAIEPACDSYFVPEAGLSDYGLTHVVTLDLSKPDVPVGGVTIVGASSTVYSSASQLVLAQPDYRWSGLGDFGLTNGQQTALHVFSLAGQKTDYKASGWVFGNLPQRNPQFGIDVAGDGTVRVATTGMVRDNPKAEPNSEDFWKQHTESYVTTARVTGTKLEQVGKSPALGKLNETVQSARFVGDRAYVVTFRQTDPLYVLDVANAAAPTVLGEISIPGFGEYMHPLDDKHLITFGQSGQGGVQLQLFDVTDPKKLPLPKTLSFGSGSSSELSYSHKALTVFEGVLALPVYNYQYQPNRTSYQSVLELVKVDANAGFTKLASIDHSRLYANNGFGVQCGSCDAMSCYEYSCGYQPELRRGHFVKGDGKTYVYSFSYAGVLVNDLSAPAKAVAQVGLPAPIFNSNGPWYGSDGLPVPTQDGGISVRDGGTTMTTVPPKPTSSPLPSSDAGAPSGMNGAVDAGVSTKP